MNAKCLHISNTFDCTGTLSLYAARQFVPSYKTGRFLYLTLTHTLKCGKSFLTVSFQLQTKFITIKIILKTATKHTRQSLSILCFLAVSMLAHNHSTHLKVNCFLYTSSHCCSLIVVGCNMTTIES